MPIVQYPLQPSLWPSPSASSLFSVYKDGDILQWNHHHDREFLHLFQETLTCEFWPWATPLGMPWYMGQSLALLQTSISQSKLHLLSIQTFCHQQGARALWLDSLICLNMLFNGSSSPSCLTLSELKQWCCPHNSPYMSVSLWREHNCKWIFVMFHSTVMLLVPPNTRTPIIYW